MLSARGVTLSNIELSRQQKSRIVLAKQLNKQDWRLLKKENPKCMRRGNGAPSPAVPKSCNVPAYPTILTRLTKRNRAVLNTLSSQSDVRRRLYKPPLKRQSTPSQRRRFAIEHVTCSMQLLHSVFVGERMKIDKAWVKLLT